jgi:2'-5' RNA ligase
MSEPVRFIIISTPPQEIAQRIDEARALICDLGASRAALAYPPHVTLRTGALVPGPLVPKFIDAFAGVVGRWSPFPVRTEGLWRTSYMDRDREKYLVGYRVRKDAPLAELNDRLLRCTTWRASDRLHFEPHLTLAFDDLDLDGYVRISHWLDENPRALPEGFEWSCDNVGLYRREGESWTPYKVWRM